MILKDWLCVAVLASDSHSQIITYSRGERIRGRDMVRKGRMIRAVKAVVVVIALLLSVLPVNILTTGVTEAEAAGNYYKGGTITLSAEGFPKNIWIYEDNSGKFVFSDGSAKFSADDDDVLSVKTNGKYSADEAGTAVLSVVPKGSSKKDALTCKVHVVEYPEDLDVSPHKKTETKPTQDAASPLQTKFKIEGIDEITSKTKLSISVTPDSTITPQISRSGDEVTLTATKGGTCTVAVTYNGVTVNFKWDLKGISCADTAYLLSPGKSMQVKVSHASVNRFKWASADKRIATVTANGRIRAKKNGNVVIMGTNKSSGYKVGCVVSVTSPAKVSAITRAREIAKGTYSQARRMQNGYYDCSSLVWRAYAPVGYNFGVSRGNAPVASSEAQYLEARGKIYATWKKTDMEKMKYQAGDMMFRTNTGNGRYRGINHVEIISGYELTGFTRSGKANVLCTWIARTPTYSNTIYEHDIIGRV